MDVAHTSLVERIARVLAGLDHNANADGVEASASGSVDDTWRAYLVSSDAVLRTIREPSEWMAQNGDPGIWSAMVDAAIKESEDI